MQLGIHKKGAPMLRHLNTAKDDVKKAQQAVLMDILSYGASTEYGRAHNFASIDSPAEFARAVPVNSYEDLRPWIQRHEKGESDVLFPGKPMFYATTSGTTAAPKRIPITRKYHDECYNGLTNLWLHAMFRENPGFMNGFDISMVGKAVEGYTEDGTTYGSFSGHMNAYMPEFIKRFRVIPFEVHDIDDYPSKYYALLRIGLEYPIRWIVAANPSSLLELHRSAMIHLESVIRDIHDGTLIQSISVSPAIRSKIEQRLRPNPKRARVLEALFEIHGTALRPKHYWPDLRVINTWKSGNAAMYLQQTAGFYGKDTVIQEFGYLATEARAGIVLSNSQETSILAAHKLFFEFVDVEDSENATPRFLLAHELEVGRRYAIYITTSSGLYRYDMNDIVRVEAFYGTFPMVRFVQKGSGVTSLTGEKLYESQYLQAVEHAFSKTGMKAGFHMAFADLPQSRYQCFIEPLINETNAVFSEAQLAEEIDRFLQEVNPEYQAKRKSNRLQPLNVHTLRPNAFEKYKRTRLSQGQREGQFKLTHLQQDTEQQALFHSLSTAVAERRGGQS